MSSMANLLEKLNARDKDEKYMAMHDLAADLDKEAIKLDGEMERRVVAIILKHLEDSGTDVKQQAVRTIASLAKKVQEAQLEDIADKLASHMLNKTDEEKRDIGSIGLKTLVGVLTAQTAPAVLKRVTPKLQQGIAQEPEVAHYCLEILNDLLKSFGLLMSRDLASIQSGILPMLSSPVPATRKRVATCVASLAICAPEQLFVTLVGAIFTNIEAARSADQIRTYIQTIAGISRSVGHRLGRELKRIVPLFMTYCEDKKYQEDVEMLENCLQAFESFVLRCPKEIGPHVDGIVTLALKFIKYDPNYADEDDDDDEDMEQEEEEADEYSDDGDYDGDDDNSWKVRSAAVKCLGAVIRSRGDLLDSLYKNVAPLLIIRLREREELVKMDVFSAFKDLLRQSQHQGGVSADDPMEQDSAGLERHPSLSLVELLDVDKVMKAVSKQLKDKSFKTKERCFEMLRELLLVLSGGLGAHLASLIPHLEKSIERSKNAKPSLRIEALLFLSLLLEKHADADFSQYVKRLGGSILECVADSNYKISSVALRVCARLATCSKGGVRLLKAGDPFVESMYAAAVGRLSSQDQDLEVKESAISTMGHLIASLGDVLGQGRLEACLPILLERLRNETTRITALKAFALIAASPLRVSLGGVLHDAVLVCADFLRKNDRALKQAALTTLKAFVDNCSPSLGPELFESVTKELCMLVSETELHLTHLALQLCVSMVQHAPSTTELVQRYILPRAMLLLQSPLLQGAARSSLKQLFSTLAATKTGGVSFSGLLKQLLDIVYGGGSPALSRQSLSSIAQCVSSLCEPVDPATHTSTVQGFIKELVTPSCPPAATEQVKLLLLHCIGEVGKTRDLSSFSLDQVIVTAFQSPNEETKSAASHALGSLAVGAIHKYLPYILQQIEAQTEHRYLYLQALRQLITLKALEGAGSSDGLQGRVGNVMALLIAQCDAEEEGVRSMVSECLGRLALIAPAAVLPQLQQSLGSPSAAARASAVHALKFAITEKAPLAQLRDCVGGFLALLRDPEIAVRRAALVTLNSAAHNKPALIRPLLSSEWLLPTLYGEMVYKKELVRTVNLGPFQHKVDDGAELRKLSLACLDTLLDKIPDKLDPSAFLQHLQERLSDELDDIKQAAYQLLSKLAVRETSAVREVLDSISEPLASVLNKRPKETASPQDVERHNELQRSVMATVAVLRRMEDSHTCPKFQGMFDTIMSDSRLKALLESVSAEADACCGV